MARRRIRSGGRPPLNRDRYAFNPRVETDVLDILREQADSAQMQLAPYMELLVAEAHGYHGEYLQLLTQLPSAVPAEELRRRTTDLTADECTPVPHDNARKWFQVDRPLADQVQRRCEELDAAYADYLRAIFREATGRTATNPRHDQLAAEIDVRRGEMRLPKAG